MNRPPPIIRIVLALVGATLVLLGAKGGVVTLPLLGPFSFDVLTLPGLGTFNFFEMGNTNAWTLVASTILVVVLSLLRPSWLAWIAWLTAIGTVIWFCRDLYLQVDKMRSNDMLAPLVEAALRTKQIKPGAVAILAGLIIQLVGLSLRNHRARTTVEH